MQLFFPTVLVTLVALMIVFAVYPSLSFQVLGGVALGAILIVVYSHITQFGDQYKFLSWAQAAGGIVPYLLVGAVIVLSLGYLTFLMGIRRGGRSSLPTPANRIPPPETATNYLTEALNEGMRAVGIANSKTPSKNLISANPSLEKNIGPTKIKSIAASRLAYQV